MFEHPPAEVCILRLSAIGDCCHIVPLLRTLQSAWPDTRFTWIVGKPEESLLRGLSGVELIPYDKASGLRGFYALRNKLKNKSFDLLLHMHPGMRANLVSLAIKARVRLGFDKERARDLHGLFTNHSIESAPRQHVQDTIFGFARAVGITERVMRWDIPLSESDRDFAAAQVGDAKCTVVISPCSSAGRGLKRNFRNWNPEYYAAVADYAVERCGARVILTGDASATTQAFAREIVRYARHDLLNLIGATSLKELLALLDRASVLVCPDSGPAHMATAVATRVVGLYASTNPDRAGPYESSRYTVNKYPESVQSAFGRSIEELPWGVRVNDRAAMQRILTEEVCDQIDRALSDAGVVSASLQGHHTPLPHTQPIAESGRDHTEIGSISRPDQA